jgi:hypothetical protein
VSRHEGQHGEVQASPDHGAQRAGIGQSGPHGVTGRQERLEGQVRRQAGGDVGHGHGGGEDQGLGGEQQAALRYGGQRGADYAAAVLAGDGEDAEQADRDLRQVQAAEADPDGVDGGLLVCAEVAGQQGIEERRVTVAPSTVWEILRAVGIDPANMAPAGCNLAESPLPRGVDGAAGPTSP